MSYKHKYLVFREKPYNTGNTVAQVDVTDLNKLGRHNKWNELEAKYPPERYVSSLTETNSSLTEFQL